MKIPVRIRSLAGLLLLALWYLLPAATTGKWPVAISGAAAATLSAESDGLFEPQWGNGWSSQRIPDEAARIRQRYHQSLQALLSARVDDLAVPYAVAGNTELRKGSSGYNSSCLSSCYDYIFRLCPF